MGDQLLKDHAAELELLDTAGVHRASMINATGIYYFTLGNFDNAIVQFLQIVTFNSTPLTRDSSLLRSTCNFLGQAYYNLGNLDKSMQYFELANRYVQKNEGDYNYLSALYFMYQGEYQFSMGMEQDAFKSLHKALQLLKQEKDISYVRNSLKSNLILLAHLYQKREDYDSAIIYVNKAIALHLKNDPDFIDNYRFLGDLYYRQHVLDSAFFYYTKSLNLSNLVYKDKHLMRSKALIGIGNVYRDQEEFAKAEHAYFESLENLSTFLLPKENMRVMFEQANLYFTWSLHKKYPVYLDSCIAILERALLLNDLSRKELFSVETKEVKALLQTQITDLGVEASFKAFELSRNNTYIMKTFAFMEKSKGNILLDQVNEIRAKEFSGIPDTILELELRLKGELSVYKDQLLRMKSTAGDFNDIKVLYDDKLREYITLISEMEKKYPRYYKLKYDAKTVQVKEIQRHLPSNRSLMIQYYVGLDKIYMVGITKNQFIIQAIPKNDEFDHNLEVLLNQLGNADILEVENDVLLFKEFERTARYLFLKILSPVLEEIKSPVKELIIIPDGYLCYLPFEILLTQESRSQQTDYSMLPYLIMKFQISYDYSASLMTENDDFESKGWRSYLGYAPAYDNSQNSSAGTLKPYILSSLYANQDEIEACQAIWNGISITGKKATERSFRALASKVNILHLATHTFLDDKDPQNSYFAFAIDNQNSENGFLYTNELYNMNILARLVILSGCETGIGHIEKGEGILSLARAFKFAGCPNIIMSLWKVNDQTTKEIMISFNRNLKKGMEKDRALQQAKISFLKGSKNLHPVFWSSFVLIGNDDPIRQTGKVVLYSLMTCCLILLAIIIIRKSRAFRR
jgi:CHAT domain-containing protein